MSLHKHASIRAPTSTRPHAHAHTHEYVILFYCNNCFANACQSYVIRTLSVLLLIYQKTWNHVSENGRNIFGDDVYLKSISGKKKYRQTLILQPRRCRLKLEKSNRLLTFRSRCDDEVGRVEIWTSELDAWNRARIRIWIPPRIEVYFVSADMEKIWSTCWALSVHRDKDNLHFISTENACCKMKHQRKVVFYLKRILWKRKYVNINFSREYYTCWKEGLMNKLALFRAMALGKYSFNC